MREHGVAEDNRPFAVDAAPWSVRDIEVLDGFSLRVRFNDGVVGLVKMAALLHGPRAGVFAALADAQIFKTATVQEGVVTWPRVLDEWPWALDLAPDAMHDEIERNGVWALDA
jgi:hypothetical protein